LLMEPSSLLNLSQSTSPKHNRSFENVPKEKKQYTLPPTENHKFEQILDLLLGDTVKLGREEVKKELKTFVQALETNYTDTIRGLKERNEKLSRQIR
jgi:hypothetical protein